MGVSAGSLHIDTSLTNVSVMYRNAEFVAEMCFPTVPVDKQSNKYFMYGIDNLRADDDTRRPGGKANEIDWTLSPNPYFCDGHALAQYIPDEWRENADAALDLDTDTTVQLTDKILLTREVNTFNVINNGLPANAQTAARWDVDTTDPIKIIDTAKETIATKIGKPPNCLCLSRPVFRGLRNNAMVKARVSGSLSGIDASRITKEQLAVLLEVDCVCVADAVQVTSKEGQAVASQYVWGKNALLFYKPPSAGLRTISLGYMFTWQKGRLGSLVYKARADRRHADWIEVMRYYDPNLVVPAAGYWFTDVVA